LLPGEKFYSVLYDRGAAFVREDICAALWQGPPPDAFSYWRGRVPEHDQPKRIEVDDALLLDCLERLAEDHAPQKINFRYVLALLLMRRKRLKFEEVVYRDGQELLALRCPKTRKLHHVLNPQLAEEQMADVQDEVMKVLGLS
jgi:hypothetical protein